MAKILIVDDEVNICNLIKKYTDHEGHESICVHNGQQAIDILETISFDLVIMDVMMPIVNGFDAVKQIRTFSKVPIIMLTAKAEEYDKIRGFDLGIDDYVVKPFSVKELMKRINAVMNRTYRFMDSIAIFNGLVIDFKARTVSIDGQRINLSPKEYKLLFYLVQNKNIALSREKLIIEIWGYDYEGDDRTLDTHIKLLRKNLGSYKDHIVTVRGVGYRFEER